MCNKRCTYKLVIGYAQKTITIKNNIFKSN